VITQREWSLPLERERTVPGLFSIGVSEYRILEAASELFGSQGYAETTIPQIVELSRVGLGTLYRRFSGKEEIFRGLYCYLCQRIAEELLPVTALLEQPLCDQLQTLWDAWWALSEKHPEWFAALELHFHPSQVSRFAHCRGGKEDEGAEGSPYLHVFAIRLEQLHRVVAVRRHQPLGARTFND
jgi:AcrR family transcriptional regulator